MGEEIQQTRFSEKDFEEFSVRLRDETELLRSWFEQHKLSNSKLRVGLELEAWLVDQQLDPAPLNSAFLTAADNSDFTQELAKFNVELNTDPVDLTGNWLELFSQQLQRNWSIGQDVARELGCELAMIGILPTVTQADLTLASISDMHRYTALNQQVLKQRAGRPLHIQIVGVETLSSKHDDVMLEAGATSLQLHLQVPLDQAARYFNASLIASAITVAVAANAPFLFGRRLWADTRIPLFEQGAEAGGFDDVAHGPIRRVGFGTGYVKHSVMELFTENAEHFPVLLPVNLGADRAHLRHLRLHNGTIWRWNRPLIGFDENGIAHLRIEHRPMSAGPTCADMVANAALYFGLVQVLATSDELPEHLLPFATARDNFYKAAQFGLDAHVTWLDGQSHRLRLLMLKEVIPMAEHGLRDLGVTESVADKYLSIIRKRVDNGHIGASWQTDFVKCTGKDMHLLLANYLKNQNSGIPVNDWPLPLFEIKDSERALNVLHEIPDGLLSVSADELHKILDRPTLIHLSGARGKELFVSVLLHGNETSGLTAIQAVLQKYQHSALPRPLSLLIGNVQAARFGLRRLDSQADFNRSWPGTELPNGPETRLMQEVFEIMAQRDVIMSVDVHNNTGINPCYGCVNRLDPQYLHLASMFSRLIVYFHQPPGVQSGAFARLCPAVTIECGKSGNQEGIGRAISLIDACLHLSELPKRATIAQDVDLFHTVAQVTIPGKLTTSFDSTNTDVQLNPELEFMNFQEVAEGTSFARLARDDIKPFVVKNDSGEDVFSHYFEVDQREVRLRRNAMPSMLTTDLRIIDQDCLCYLMERFPLYR